MIEVEGEVEHGREGERECKGSGVMKAMVFAAFLDVGHTQ